MTQQRIYRRFPTPECLERLHCGATSACFQNRFTVLSACFNLRLALFQCFFERCIGIRRQHLSPFITVIACRVAARKNVTECVCRAAVRRRFDDRNLLAYLVQQGHHVSRRVVGCVQQHVKQRKLNLAQRLHAALEVFGCQHFVKQRARQWLIRVDMSGHVFEHIPFPAKVLHELARQLDGVPFHAADARHITLVDLCQHVVQPVAKFMEQRRHIVMRKQRRLAAHTVGKVAHQMRDRRLQLVRVRPQPAGAHVVHPGAAAFAGARRLVQIKLTYQNPSAFNAEKLHARLPHGCFVFANRHFKQRFNDFEQTRQHLGRSEILFDFLFAKRIARFLELFGNVRKVPRLRF